MKEDLLIHGDSVYDIIDKQDHAAIQSELLRNTAATNCASLNPGKTRQLTTCSALPSLMNIFVNLYNTSQLYLNIRISLFSRFTESIHSPSSAAAAAAAAASLATDRRMFLCRMNVSRNSRRQMRFGDQKVRETDGGKKQFEQRERAVIKWSVTES